MKQQVNIFKNSGIRDIAKQEDTFWSRVKECFKKTNTFFTYKNVSFLSCALSIYLKAKFSNPCNILIGTDTRPSSKWIKKSLISEFKMLNHNIFDTDIVPTPFLAKALKDYKNVDNNNNFFQIGIMVTASHNPAQYNGIKIMTPAGYLTEDDEIYISEIFHELIKNPKILLKHLNLSIKGRTNNFNCSDLYIKKTTEEIKPFKSTDKIVIDCANGSTYDFAQKIFSSYFQNIIPINNSSDGNLINHNSGCTNPILLIKAIQQNNADWGCAFDGDGDRVIIADKKGNIYDGDDILITLSHNEKFKDEKIFIGTIMNNMVTEKYFTSHNKTLIRTAVGERNLIDALDKYNAQLGSEPCGHITIMDHAKCSDGIFSALLFFQTTYSNLNILNNTYKKYSQIHENISLDNNIFTDDKIIETIIFNQNKILPNGRIVIRKSNTEPILRLMVEHENYDIAKKIITDIKKQLTQ